MVNIHITKFQTDLNDQIRKLYLKTISPYTSMEDIIIWLGVCIVYMACMYVLLTFCTNNTYPYNNTII